MKSDRAPFVPFAAVDRARGYSRIRAFRIPADVNAIKSRASLHESAANVNPRLFALQVPIRLPLKVPVPEAAAPWSGATLARSRILSVLARITAFIGTLSARGNQFTRTTSLPRAYRNALICANAKRSLTVIRIINPVRAARNYRGVTRNDLCGLHEAVLYIPSDIPPGTLPLRKET